VGTGHNERSFQLNVTHNTGNHLVPHVTPIIAKRWIPTVSQNGTGTVLIIFRMYRYRFWLYSYIVLQRSEHQPILGTIVCDVSNYHLSDICLCAI
jgi:hypothetical protein